MKRQVDLAKHCKSLIRQYGSTRAAGDALGIDFAYLHRMASGTQTNPSDEVLAKIGLVRVSMYYRKG